MHDCHMLSLKGHSQKHPLASFISSSLMHGTSSRRLVLSFQGMCRAMSTLRYLHACIGRVPAAGLAALPGRQAPAPCIAP